MRSRQRTLGLTGVRRWRHHENVDSKDVPQLVRWWLWKFFARMDFNKNILFDEGGVNDSALAKTMGLGHWIDVSNFLYEQAQEEFSSRYKELEKNSKRVKAPQPLRRNVLKISRLLGLSKVECRILEFLILSHNLSFFRRCLHKNEIDGGRREVAHFFSQLFDLPEKVVLHALSSDGMLIRSGMLACSFDRFHASLPRMLEVKPETLDLQMFYEEIDTTTLLRFWASPSAPPELSLADYTHFSQPIDTLRAYLKIALATKRKGVNVFVYGPPGTGKTQPLLPPTVDPKVFETVSMALYENHWLQLDYKNAAGRRAEIEVMPLGLAQQGPRLYLVCRYRGYDNERTLALHRILSAMKSISSFKRPKEFDLEKYDDDGRFGFGDGRRIRLTFQIQKEAGYHLLESRLSEDQEVREIGDHYEISATVVDTEQLNWWLRGFGDQVTHVH